MWLRRRDMAWRGLGRGVIEGGRHRISRAYGENVCVMASIAAKMAGGNHQGARHAVSMLGRLGINPALAALRGHLCLMYESAT